MESEALSSVLAAVGVMSAFVLALVEFIKRQGLPDRLAPVAALVSGIVMVFFAGFSGIIDIPYAQQAFAGVLAGLAAGGFYSGGKAVVGK